MLLRRPQAKSEPSGPTNPRVPFSRMDGYREIHGNTARQLPWRHIRCLIGENAGWRLVRRPHPSILFVISDPFEKRQLA